MSVINHKKGQNMILQNNNINKIYNKITDKLNEIIPVQWGKI